MPYGNNRYDKNKNVADQSFSNLDSDSHNTVKNDDSPKTGLNDVSLSWSYQADVVFLLMFLIFIVIYRETIDNASNSTVLIGVVVIMIGKKMIDYFDSAKRIEGMAILSNEAIQTINTVINGGTVTVTKQYCIDNNGTVKCLNWNNMFKNGVNPI
ncbi:hypothetical protein YASMINEVIRUS_907 [Yasminevirus sp. GU-2018]|uniref:Uncharacterized protein n=1 Tax=Yasminevirus sp. GU-2018 TaxID=2420051 RepID=A0A5K0UAE8_9VIRU|nr:hypothetical protein YASMINEVIRUS_907 [Yasminevirus sp. GU-2018]